MSAASEARKRYNKKTYATIKVDLRKELVQRFKEKVKSRGDSQAWIIKKAIEDYLVNG